MLLVHVLSYDSTFIQDEERLQVFRWVRVGAQQVKEGMSVLPVLPEDKVGDIVRYGIEERGFISLRVMGDGKLRELTKAETETGVTNIPIPRI